jgi:hypothetical protein
LIAVLCDNAERGLIDRPIGVGRRGNAPPLWLRLVALNKSPQAAAAARRTARREAPRGGHQISPATLAAADWVILVTSLLCKRHSRPPTSWPSTACAGVSNAPSNG